ncbi:hypothetical protein [Anaeromyxobacter oryzae]|uniref:Integral membrane protein n=1 Tax=Anaeromyxobacter oryzae TaxID=2918170 RepID=A0ABM7WUW6_9BACT|nr:hypothetical protein [Anaeromyxobacter oryzae]BDG03293.1 hypothetical protein AMOR_22890 [Anaeromyxobacter oryzae]
MSVYDFAGLAGGLGGAALFLAGVLVAIFAALRLAVAGRRPGKGRVARGLAAGGGVLAAEGAALFWVAELAPFRRAVDHVTGPLAGVALVLGAVVTWRVARRRPAPAPAEETAASGGPTAAAR